MPPQRPAGSQVSNTRQGESRPSIEELLLLLLGTMSEPASGWFRELELHAAVACTQDILNLQVKIVRRPILFSPTVDRGIRKLLADGSLDHAVLTQVGHFTTHSYRLSSLGTKRAWVLSDALSRSIPGLREILKARIRDNPIASPSSSTSVVALGAGDPN